MQVDVDVVDGMRRHLADLAALLREARFDSDTDEEREREHLVRVVESYLLPRIAQADGPVVVAVVGPSGTGKSTVLASLAQDLVSTTGVLRPTTRHVVVWAHADHEQETAVFVEAGGDYTRPEAIYGRDPLTEHVSFVDTPPIDFVDDEGRSVAAEVLDLADVCVFVTSPTRYADAIGWDFVRDAQRRGVPTIFVLNRLPQDRAMSRSLLEDLAARLFERRLLLEPDPEMIFPVVEAAHTLWHGGLDPGAVAALRAELAELSDPDFRTALTTQTVFTTTVALADRAGALVTPLEEEGEDTAGLRRVVATAYEDQAAQLGEEIDGGLFAEVADRGTREEIVAALATTLVHRAGRAAREAARAWDATERGRRLLATAPGLRLHAAGTEVAASAAVAEVAAAAPQLATHLSRRGRLRLSAARRAGDEALRVLLDGTRRRPRYLRRWFGDGLDGFLAALRERVSRAVAECLQADAERFTARIGEMPVGLAGRVAATAHLVLTLARSVVPQGAEEEPVAGAKSPVTPPDVVADHA